MSGNFYQVLFFSLLLTLGAVLAYFGYRYFIAKYGSKPNPIKYVVLHNLEKNAGIGEITFYFHIPESVQLKLEVLDMNDHSMFVLEDRMFELGDFRIKFDSKSVPNGDYFYKITTPHQQTAKKFSINNA